MAACALALPVAASGQTDTPAPTPTLSLLCTKATEGAGIRCTTGASRSGTATVTYGAASDSASPDDFGTRPTSFPMTAGGISSFTIPTRDDAEYENDETLSVKVTFGTAVGRTTATVVDNEVHPGIAPGKLELVSRSATGGPANGASGHPKLGVYGRMLAFDSLASNMLPPAADLNTASAGTESDTNGVSDVYLDDRGTPAGPMRVSVTDKQVTEGDPVAREREANGPSFVTFTTEQFVNFVSDASNLVSKGDNDTNELRDAFRHVASSDFTSLYYSHETERYGHVAYKPDYTQTPTGGQNNGPAIGLWMHNPDTPILLTQATNIYGPVPAPAPFLAAANARRGVPFGVLGAGVDLAAGVGFASEQTGNRQIAWGDQEKFRLAYMPYSGPTTRGVVFQYTDKSVGNYAEARLRHPAIAMSRLLVFTTAAGNFATTPEDGNGVDDVYGIPLEQMSQKPVQPLSLSSDETLGNGPSDNAETGGLQGRYVVFESDATNLVPRDVNGKRDIFLRDREAGTTELISATTAGRQLNGDSFNPQVSDDGNTIAFETAATNADVAPVNGVNDVVVRVRTGTLSPAAAIGGPASSVRGTFRVSPKRGLPKLAAPTSTSFSLLADPRKVPVDTLIDAHGRAQVQVRSGKASAIAGGGQFQLAKTKKLPLLRLVGGREKTICGAKPRAVLRKLAVTARGRIAVAAGAMTARPAKGTTFTVAEACDGVRVKVARGILRVRHNDRVRVLRPGRPRLLR
jgi:hypothetical protein